ncbi:hypothetical protein [Streptomyces sp. MAR4 CNX-425]|uniref:hypothetical protein n=1 Tax=Streptomyces sp. MAR4 CNX-425 TaxID=3406343 RepID=UPI003B509568
MAPNGEHEWSDRQPPRGLPALPAPAEQAPQLSGHLDAQRLADLEALVARQGEELRRLSGSRGRFRPPAHTDAEQVQKQIQWLTGRIVGLEAEVEQLRAADLRRGLDELRARVAEMDRLLDGVRGERVQDAINSGEVTSDLHRRHMRNADAYRTLVAQDLRRLAVLLCPVGPEQDEPLAARRARAVAGLLGMLFAASPAGRPPAVEELVAQLAAGGYATDQDGFGQKLGQTVDRAADIARELAGGTLPATLVFGADVRGLPPGAYEPYNSGATGVPGFLVAPAYVIDGDRPLELARPLVFVVPADAGAQPGGAERGA